MDQRLARQADTTEKPVFATASGRPRRGVNWIGRAAALIAATWVAAIVVGTSGVDLPPLTLQLAAVHGQQSLLTPQRAKRIAVYSPAIRPDRLLVSMRGGSSQ